MPLVMNVLEPLRIQPSLESGHGWACGGADALQVRSGRRFRHPDRRDELAGDEARQPARLLLVVAQREQVGRADVVVQREADADRTGVDDLLAEDRVVAEVADAGAAEILRHLEAEQAGLARLLPDLAVDDAGRLPSGGVRRGFAGQEVAAELAEGVVLVVKDGRGSRLPACHVTRAGPGLSEVRRQGRMASVTDAADVPDGPRAAADAAEARPVLTERRGPPGRFCRHHQPAARRNAINPGGRRTISLRPWRTWMAIPSSGRPCSPAPRARSARAWT